LAKTPPRDIDTRLFRYYLPFMPGTNILTTQDLTNQATAETLRDLAIGGVCGFVIGFLLKKALKLGLLLLAAFLAWQFFTYGRIDPDHIETAQGLHAGATNYIGQYAEEISSVRNLFQVNTKIAIGFFAGLALGLWKG
jgi:uncharacterized membrane protein (Fun14 family)